MKTIFITGASSGIGKATARLFHERGWNVAATMRSPEKEKELTTLPNLLCLPLDVTDTDSIAHAVSRAIERFGSIDVLLNNAGFSLIGPFETASPAEVLRQYDTNVFGLMNVTRALLPHFRQRRQGTIINIASIGGRIGFPLYSLYNSTKFAVEGFSESLSHELRPLGIQIKLIEPGVILTDFYGRSMAMTQNETSSAYEPYASQTLKKLMNVGTRGSTPEKAARKIFNAARKRNNRLRYSIGADAKLLLFIKRLYPFRFLRWVLRRVT